MRAGDKQVIAREADHERKRILTRDILGHPAIHLYRLPVGHASRELTKFADILRKTPKMAGYFDRRHLVNLRAHVKEALHGFATLAGGGVLELVSIPALPDRVMCFHIYTVFDPNDDQDTGVMIGYAVYSLERGKAGFGHADAIRLAFDIFPAYREGRYEKVAFTNHEIYNATRRMLMPYRPRRFLVDARTQIRQPRTGDPFKRAIYYLKRGYYPPDRKPAADRLLVRLLREQPLARRAVLALVRSSAEPFWVFPVQTEKTSGD